MHNSKTYINKTESVAISWLRTSSVIMIVLCHILQGMDNNWAWVFNIGVQIFFILSGYLYGKKTIDDNGKWYIRRAFRILTPFYLYLLFALSVIQIWKMELISYPKIITYLFNLQGLLGGVEGLNHLWFLTWIVGCYIITPMIQIIIDKRYIYLLGCIILILMVLSIFHGYLLNVALYVVSYSVSRLNKILSSILFTTLIIISIIVLSTFTWERLLIGGVYCKLFHLVISAIIVVGSLQFFHKKGKKRILVPQSVNLIDRYSYEIYLCHHFIILGPVSLLHITESITINILLIISLTILQAFLLKLITSQIINVLHK